MHLELHAADRFYNFKAKLMRKNESSVATDDRHCDIVSSNDKFEYNLAQYLSDLLI